MQWAYLDMRILSGVLLMLSMLAFSLVAQTKPRSKAPPAKIPSAVPVKVMMQTEKADGRTYTNPAFGFELNFPMTWLIPGDDFEEQMKKQGFDLSLKAPDSLPIVTRTQINRAVKNVNILLTAYRSMPGSADNAIVRISAEDLTTHPQIRDAVDYFDAIRASYAGMKLPGDFSYSETQAEKLGAMQFGFIDVSNKAGKKRMYATVRNRHAIQFTLSYSRDEDLETFRRVLAEGNFRLKMPTR
jgi:hypothetical protein